MSRFWIIGFLLLACCLPARAQFTAVTANVTDGNGRVYQNCSGSASFVPSPTATTVPTINGSTFQTIVPIASCDSFGNFNLTLVDNAQVSDGHTGGQASQWAFFIQSANVCFVGQKVSFTTTLTITGSSQNISTALTTASAPLPSCTTSAAGSSGQIQFNNANSLGAIVGSNVTPATGATMLTAGADTTTPLAITSHSTTQSAPLFDVNNQSSGTADTPFVVRGRGFGSFTPSANKALYHLIEESDALAHFGWAITNHAADVSKGTPNLAMLGMGVNDSGLAQIAGGGAVGDAAENYWCLTGDANESLFASICNPAAGAAIVPFYVKGATSQTADIFEIKSSTGSVLARYDAAGDSITTGISDGLLSTQVTTGTSANLCTNLAQITFNQEGTAGQAVSYTLCTAAAGKRQCVMNSNGGAANTGVLTVNASAAGQFIIFTDGTLSASGGNVTSGGAAGDAACFYGVDATHWQMTVQQGTWTKH